MAFNGVDHHIVTSFTLCQMLKYWSTTDAGKWTADIDISKMLNNYIILVSLLLYLNQGCKDLLQTV